MTVTVEETGLQLSWNSFQGPLAHFHFDTFTYAGPGPLHDEVVQFDTLPDGAVGLVRLLGRKVERKG